MQNTLTIPVLIIGAGPAGMLAAISLANAGIACTVVERHDSVRQAPRAHAVNPRTLEICQRLGIDSANIRAQGAHRDAAGRVYFNATLTGTVFGSLPYERQDDGALAHTPFPLVNISQPALETILRTALLEQPLITLLSGVTATVVEQTEQDVKLLMTGEQTTEARASYVIAADGAGSRTRETLGIKMQGPETLQQFMMIHFNADLKPHTLDRPGLLYFCLDPARSGTFIGYDASNSWVFMQGWDPASQNADDFTDAYCKELINNAAGTDLGNMTIAHKSPWTMSAQVAEQYRQGRVFLAGDAAHRFPPTGGLGLNTGVADAQNLAWKLAKVIKGEGGDALLESYATERQPIAQINSHQSLKNSAKLFELFGALYGADPAQTPARFSNICADLAAYPEVAAAVEVQRPHFDSLNLQLGYGYGAAVDPDSIDISAYEPSFEVGRVLPHTPLRTNDGTSNWLLGRLSATEFSLVAGPRGQAWQAAGLPVLVEIRDFTLATGNWWQQAGLPEGGALLIRPDGHIAGQLPIHNDQAQEKLTQLLASLLNADVVPSQGNSL